MTQCLLTGLLKFWRERLSQNKITGTILLDLFQVFDCIPHNLLTTKFNAFGFNRNTLTFLGSSLKNRKLFVRIKSTYKPTHMKITANLYMQPKLMTY